MIYRITKMVKWACMQNRRANCFTAIPTTWIITVMNVYMDCFPVHALCLWTLKEDRSHKLQYFHINPHF